MSGWSIAVKAVIAILAVVMAWRTKSENKGKWLATLIVFLWALSAVLDIAQDRHAAREQATIRAEQKQVADALNVLKNNSEQEKRARESETQHRKEIVGQLTGLMNEGIRARSECQQPQSHADAVWTKKVESQLHALNSADETTFKNSESPLICYQSMEIKMAALQRIIDRYN